MAVYVDPLINYGWKLGPSCHMTADTIEELNALAVKIGLKFISIAPCLTANFLLLATRS